MIASVERLASTPELSAALEDALSAYFGARRCITTLKRRVSDYRSSFVLEELGVGLDDGTRLDLIFKNASPRALLAAARAAKPSFLRDSSREIDVYRTILAGRQRDTAICYGAVVDSQRDRYWLFLEKVAGVELYQVGDFTIWQEVARWLARMHVGCMRESDWLARNQTPSLLRYDRAYYRRWLSRALTFRSAGESGTDARSQRLRRLSERFDLVIERLTALPHTLLHGEFYASNILIQKANAALRVCPVDWEMAAIGPALIDLAAFTAGKWTEAERESLAMAYYSAIRESVDWFQTEREFLEACDYCRLLVAIQWLGWSRSWIPPAQHAHDWLDEALCLAEKLGL